MLLFILAKICVKQKFHAFVYLFGDILKHYTIFVTTSDAHKLKFWFLFLLR